MISEKTVELNLTTELLNWMWGRTQVTHYVIAPSQRAEAELGFDAAFHGSGSGLFIQFKRAHVSGSCRNGCGFDCCRTYEAPDPDLRR